MVSVSDVSSEISRMLDWEVGGEGKENFSQQS